MIASPSIPNYTTPLYLAVLALVLTLNSYRSLSGTRYRGWRVFLRPGIYLLLALILLALDPKAWILSTLAGIAGVVTGTELGSSVNFYYNGVQLYYRRSPTVYLIWLAVFLLRVFLSTWINLGTQGLQLLDALLLFSSGLLLGESYHILFKAREFKARNSGP